MYIFFFDALIWLSLSDWLDSFLQTEKSLMNIEIHVCSIHVIYVNK